MRKVSVHEAITAMIFRVDGVISVPEPPMISVLCSESRGMIGSALVLLFSSYHTIDGLKSLSTKVLGGTGSRLVPIRARMSAAKLLSRAT